MTTVAEMTAEAARAWKEWSARASLLAAGIHNVIIKDVGPKEMFLTHGNDQQVFVETVSGLVLLLSESSFKPFVSRHDIAPGMKLEIVIGQNSGIESVRVL